MRINLSKLKKVTNQEGKSRFRLYYDKQPRKSVKEATNCKSLTLVCNGYTKWGSHKIVHVLGKVLKKNCVLSVGRDLKGWAFVDVNLSEVEVALKRIGKALAPNWRFSIKKSTVLGIKLSTTALNQIGDDSSPDDEGESSEEDNDEEDSGDDRSSGDDIADGHSAEISEQEDDGEEDDDAPMQEKKKQRVVVSEDDEPTTATAKKAKNKAATTTEANRAINSYFLLLTSDFLHLTSYRRQTRCTRRTRSSRTSWTSWRRRAMR